MSVAELLVMAKALQVPPLLLLTPPPGSGETVAVLPGVDAAAPEALAWIDGTAPGSSEDEGADVRAELRLLRDHQELVKEWTARTRAASIAEARAGDPEEPHRSAWRDAAHGHAQAAEHAAARIASLREEIRARGLAMPKLPPGLIHLNLRG
ncbi:hypothetical protein ACU635_59030 [[Actinomadura] parvosata]|uniref:hypothetical protein n=1 Tax=[Actinomadura] parvosata TaxID=1955412 RepID=UPI00406C580F